MGVMPSVPALVYGGHKLQMLDPSGSPGKWMARDLGSLSKSGSRRNGVQTWVQNDKVTVSLLPQEIMSYLTMEELTDLIWTVIEGLGSTSAFRVQAAAQLFLDVIQECEAKLETTKVWDVRTVWEGGAEG